MNPIAGLMVPGLVKQQGHWFGEWRLQSTLWTQWKDPIEVNKVNLDKGTEVSLTFDFEKAVATGNGYGSSLPGICWWLTMTNYSAGQR